MKYSSCYYRHHLPAVRVALPRGVARLGGSLTRRTRAYAVPGAPAGGQHLATVVTTRPGDFLSADLLAAATETGAARAADDQSYSRVPRQA